MSHCNNPPTESTLDPPYGEIQEIYEKRNKDAEKVKELNWTINSLTESTLNPPFGEIQEILDSFFFKQ